MEGIKTSDENVLLYEVNDQHFYLHVPTKTWMRSVTSITGVYPKGIGFYRWLSSKGSLEAADQEKEAGGDRGTSVHSGISSLIAGEKIRQKDFPENAWPHLLAFKNWHDDHQPKYLANEVVVYDVRRRIAGTLDILAEINGKIGVIDEKTAKYIYRAAEHQSNEYAHLLNQMQGDTKVEFAAVLRTNSKHRRRYEYKQWDVSKKMHKVFVSMHFVAHDFDSTMEPTFPAEVPDTISLSDVERNEDTGSVAVEGNGAERYTRPHE